MMTNSDLNHDHDEARALHRVVRAMHDGECPKCHRLHPAEVMLVGPPMGHQCPSCGFSISTAESEAALAEFGKFMDANLAVFEKWRASRSDRPITTQDVEYFLKAAESVATAVADAEDEKLNRIAESLANRTITALNVAGVIAALCLMIIGGYTVWGWLRSWLGF